MLEDWKLFMMLSSCTVPYQNAFPYYHFRITSAFLQNDAMVSTTFVKKRKCPLISSDMCHWSSWALVRKDCRFQTKRKLCGLRGHNLAFLKNKISTASSMLWGHVTLGSYVKKCFYWNTSEQILEKVKVSGQIKK